VLLFSSGKCVLIGTISKTASILACKRVTKCLTRIGLAVNASDLRIQNIVTTTTCKYKLRLYNMAAYNTSQCTYNPEIFPGLHLRFDGMVSKQVFNAFTSGKIILTGTRDLNSIKLAYKKLDLFFSNKDFFFLSYLDLDRYCIPNL
jgi:transcription initiation factor TFIID TATA-box-binding protein